MKKTFERLESVEKFLLQKSRGIYLCWRKITHLREKEIAHVKFDENNDYLRVIFKENNHYYSFIFNRSTPRKINLQGVKVTSKQLALFKNYPVIFNEQIDSSKVETCHIDSVGNILQVREFFNFLNNK